MIKIETKSIIKVAAAIFILFLLISYWPFIASLASSGFQALTPLFVGCFIAYYLNILMSFYERHFFPKSKKKSLIKLRRPMCIVLAILTLIAILAVILALVIPQLISCFEIFGICSQSAYGIATFIDDLSINLYSLGSGCLCDLCNGCC